MKHKPFSPLCRFSIRRSVAAVGLAIVSAVVISVSANLASAAETGAQIYARLCASCHGDKGQGGTAEYAQPLTGDKPVSELAALIDRTMPAGEPEQLDAAQSHVVAAYVYDAFYSPIAQARNQPARIELARLTVRQYRNVLTDLVSSFRWNNQWGTERGLKGEYYDSRHPNKGKRQIERVDPVVKFNFGEGSPLKDKINAEEFCAMDRCDLRSGNRRLRICDSHRKRRQAARQHGLEQPGDRRQRPLRRRS
ncbi:MAG: cytochrome c [Pirellulales bacterium]